VNDQEIAAVVGDVVVGERVGLAAAGVALLRRSFSSSPPRSDRGRRLRPRRGRSWTAALFEQLPAWQHAPLTIDEQADADRRENDQQRR
jgi:hypothetical protein